MGWWTLVGAGGPVLGVAAGGPVVQAFGWRWVFVGQAPLIAIAIVAVFQLLPDTPPLETGRIHLSGAIALGIGVAGLLLALNRGVDGWTSPVVLASLGGAVLGLVAFWRLERYVDSPLFPVEWVRRRTFLLPCFASFTLNFAYMGGFFLTPIFLERSLGYAVGVTGLMQIARPLVFAVSAPVAGYLAVKTGERAAAIVGTSLMVGSMLLFASVGQHSGAVVIVAALGLSGLATGVALPSLSASLANAVEIEQMGSASAAMQVFSQIGVVAGIQLMETVQTGRAPHGLLSSFHDAYLVGAAVSLVAVGCAAMVRSTALRRPADPAYGEFAEVPAIAAGAVGEHLAAERD